MFIWYLKIWLQDISNFILLRKIQNLFLIKNIKMFWCVLPIYKGSLTSLLHIDSCWVYLILRSLTTLLYAVHVCRGASHLLLCIAYYVLCELGLVIPSSCNACWREVNLASSSSWMYIAYIFYWLIWVHLFVGENIVFCVYLNPFVDDWQKGGEVFEMYLINMHVFLALFIKGEFLCLCIYVLFCK